MKVPMRHVAHARAGDKGDTLSIGVFAYAPEFYPYLKDQLTPEHVAQRLSGVVIGPVRRYEIDGLHSMNFVIDRALAGGVSRSLRLDQYGKTLSAALLGIEIEVPDTLREHLVGLR